jgi:ubiquinone/menaquinone biosynthesis C-methylase UbiE
MIVDKRLLKHYYERQGEESDPHVYESMSLRNILFVNRRRIIRNLLAAQGASLDLGCGTGIYSVDLVRKGCEVVSLDISRSYLLKARKLSVTLGVSNMQNFIEADAEYLQFRSNAFDFVLCSETLEHVAD